MTLVNNVFVLTLIKWFFFIFQSVLGLFVKRIPTYLENNYTSIIENKKKLTKKIIILNTKIATR